MARQLEAEADIIASLMTKGLEQEPSSDAALALSKYGVLPRDNKSSMAGFSAEQFAQATQRGTLYAELSARL